MLPPKLMMNLGQLGRLAQTQTQIGQPQPFPVTPAPSPAIDIAPLAAGAVAIAFVLDAAVGGVAGWWLAPNNKKLGYVVGGAAATSFAGSLGLLGLIGYHHFAGD